MAVTRSIGLLESRPVASTGEGETARVSITTSRNVAKDSAIQVNGHIANEVHNWNCNTLIINYYLLSTARRRNRPSNIDRLPLGVLEKHSSRSKSKLSTTGKHVSRKIQHCHEQRIRQCHESTVLNLKTQYLTLVSETLGKKGAVCATFRDDCQTNFVANRIVKRFNLTTYVDCSTTTSTDQFGEYKITPSRNYVALGTATAMDSKQTPHRFYVVEHCSQFDVLIGSDIIAQLLSSAKEDEPIGPVRPTRSKP